MPFFQHVIYFFVFFGFSNSSKRSVLYDGMTTTQLFFFVSNDGKLLVVRCLSEFLADKMLFCFRLFKCHETTELNRSHKRYKYVTHLQLCLSFDSNCVGILTPQIAATGLSSMRSERAYEHSQKRVDVVSA